MTQTSSLVATIVHAAGATIGAEIVAGELAGRSRATWRIAAVLRTMLVSVQFETYIPGYFANSGNYFPGRLTRWRKCFRDRWRSRGLG
jgi:hypothetical protein